MVSYYETVEGAMRVRAWPRTGQYVDSGFVTSEGEPIFVPASDIQATRRAWTGVVWHESAWRFTVSGLA